MPGKIRLALAGVGNCASALLQGLAWYAQNDSEVGLTQRVLGGYDVCDITPVLAFDVSAHKVGRDLGEAIMAPPNCAWQVPEVCVGATGVEVLPGPVAECMPPHLAKYAPLSDAAPVDLVQALRDSGAEVLLNMLPTGSAQASRLYAQAGLGAGDAGSGGGKDGPCLMWWCLGNDVCCLGSLGTFLNIESDLLPFLEGLEAGTLDRAEVDEDVLTAAILGNESVTLGFVEPFDSACSHRKLTCKEETKRRS